MREKEDNYFFRLSAFQDDLVRLLDEQPDFVMPRHRYNEARSFIESGLQDVSLSRSTLTWGVPVPWDSSHVFYVWFDALLNYYTALSYAKPGEDLTERFWPAQFHVIGKDILKFHTVFWPAMLMAAGLPLPEHVFVHGFLLMVGKDGGARWASRWATRSTRSRSSTSSAPTRCASTSCATSPSARTARCPRTASRSSTRPSSPTTSATSPAARSRWSTATATAPSRPPRPTPQLVADVDPMIGEVCELLDRADLTGALDAIWQRVRRLNRYVEEQAPWVLAKDEARAGDLDRVLASLSEGLRVVAVALHPWIPESVGKLLGALAAPELELDGARMPAGRLGAIATLEPLFPKPQ